MVTSASLISSSVGAGPLAHWPPAAPKVWADDPKPPRSLTAAGAWDAGADAVGTLDEPDGLDSEEREPLSGIVILPAPRAREAELEVLDWLVAMKYHR